MQTAIYLLVTLALAAASAAMILRLATRPRFLSQRAGMRTGGVAGIALTLVYAAGAAPLFGTSMPALVYVVYVGLLCIGAGVTGGFLAGTLAHWLTVARHPAPQR